MTTIVPTDWVQVRDITWAAAANTTDAEGQAVQFAIHVSRECAADATLWFDANGLPQRREQLVEFPGGEMRVIEEYEVVAVD